MSHANITGMMRLMKKKMMMNYKCRRSGVKTIIIAHSTNNTKNIYSCIFILHKCMLEQRSAIVSQDLWT